ncbi:MAG: SUMF1/EgtB/PvdO family nonheme iron enzyme [Paludibacteraceae bacterium]|nr:SUMF1/EgtB/PvdO family nonheme iron enzyme [Paludibacteraceae bacterium]
MNKKMIFAAVCCVAVLFTACEKEGMISISLVSKDVSAEGETFQVQVTSTAAWTATANQTWLTLSPASGTGDAYVTVTVAANTSTTADVAEVLFAISGVSVKLTVNRAGTGSGGGGSKTYTVNGVSFKMITVAGGTFQMGAQSTDPNGQNYDAEANSYENPVHQVTLIAFTIGETEVTQALWEEVMGSNPSYFKDPDLPVEQVSWDDCQTFLTKLNQLTGKTFRLPTEAEWEYAARGGNKSQGYKYSGSNTIGNVAWYYDNGGSKTHAVGTKQANELGIYDMSGNVWEWCSDWYDSYSSSSQTNPTGAASGSYRVLRGGSWNYNATFCRVSLRSGYYPDGRYFSRGLRLVF